jgi:hypothetical protein
LSRWAANNYAMFPVHAHLKLLGRNTQASFGLYYRLVPAATGTTLANLQLWLDMPAPFVQMARPRSPLCAACGSARTGRH